MTVTATATIRVKFPTEDELLAVFEAVEPETRVSSSNRSKVRVRRGDKTLTLIFEASDTSALRAALNSYLHWIRLAKDVLATVESK